MKKLNIYFLILCLLLSSFPLTAFAQTNIQAVGDLEVTLKLNYPKGNTKYDKGQIVLSLLADNRELVELDIQNGDETQDFELNGENYTATVKRLDKNNNVIKDDNSVGTYRIKFNQIPCDTYQIKLSGDGFKNYLSENITLEKYYQHIIVADDNATFTLGDTNDDGKVNSEDLKYLNDFLAKKELTSNIDLNKDGLCDIIDLAYVLNNINATGKAEIQSTNLIASKVVDISSLTDTLKQNYGGDITEEKVANIFKRDNTEILQLESKENISSENPVDIPISFGDEESVEIHYINITVPNDDTAIKNGFIEFEEDGNKIKVPFGEEKTKSYAVNDGMIINQLPLADESREQPERKVITINLGKRVAVKKITIKVTGTEGDNKLASIATVEFLKDITAENPDTDDKNTVKNLTATADNESVVLNWSALSNVTGYKVRYGTSRGNYDKEATTDTNSIKISGLDNYTDYYFSVSAINGDWKGPWSDAIKCTPIANSKPLAPGNVSINAGDRMLSVSWSKAKNATSHNLYYKEEGETSYKKIENLNNTSYILSGLTNDKNYLIYIVGVNQLGEGQKSSESIGTPKKMIIEKPKGIPTYNQISNTHIQDIKLTHKDYVDLGQYPNGFDVRNVIDEDYATHWTARIWWENSGFVVTFDKAYEMDHMVQVMRLDDIKYRNVVDRYSITVWKDGDDLSSKGEEIIPTWKYIPDASTKSEGYLVLTFPKSNVKQIKVMTHIFDGSKTQTNASELIFYEYYSLIDEITALFADNLHTKLKSDVTLEQIQTLRSKLSGETGEFYVNKNALLLELNLAESILNGSSDKLGNIISVNQTKNANEDSNRGFSFTLNDYQPLGIVSEANKDLVVYIDVPNPEKGMPTLHATQYFAEPSKWSIDIPLQQGRNVITVPKIGSTATQRGGSLYVSYNGQLQDEIKIHIIGGKKIPVLSLSDITIDNISSKENEVKAKISTYIDELVAYVPTIAGTNKQLAIENSTEIETKNVLLSVPATEILSGITSSLSSKQEKIDRMYHAIAAWEETMSIHYKVAGLSDDAIEGRDKLPSARINIRYMRMFDNAFMYAGGAHIGVGYNSCSSFAKGYPSTVKSDGLYGWGINHEIGHVLDNNKLVYAETTNNIYSLFAQTYDGRKNIGISRLEGGIYDKIYDKVSVKSPGKANNVFVQLGMYWQLHLAYDDEGNNFDFYGKLNKLSREGNIKNSDKDNLFIMLASEAAQKDLRPFFEQWGIAINKETNEYLDKQNLEEETRALYYLNDEARRYRLDDGKGMSEGINLDGSQVSIDNEKKEVSITINQKNEADDEHILGYEIYRNDKAIAFTTEKTYVDKIPSANNMSFQYSVKVYDKLLNGTDRINIGDEIKLIHDGTIDNKEFTYTTSGSSIVIDMQKEYNIAGLKVNAPVGTVTSNTAISVSLDNKEFTIAKNASLTEGENLLYFNKPGTDSSDARIWTYNARYIYIENKEGALSYDNINIIKYPGDNIEIDQGAIGYLGHDYKYGEDKDDVIKKGTLIVTGSYRGDPIYNAIKLVGIFTDKNTCVDDAKLGISSNTALQPDDGTVKDEVKIINGYQLFFAEVPQDGKMIEISNGFWIYVPEQADAYKLPDKIKAELYRVDDPETLEGERLVSDTIWITSPTHDSMPIIMLEGDTK